MPKKEKGPRKPKQNRRPRDPKSLVIRAPLAWHHTLERLTEDLGENPSRHRSKVVRDLVTQEFQLVGFSPYRSPRALYFILVCKDGTMIHWMAQRLYLLQYCKTLPAEINVKPEKRRHYDHAAREPSSPEQNWLMNYFAAWKGDRVPFDGQNNFEDNQHPLAEDVDRAGLIIKRVDLLVNENSDTTICREILVANRDYVQRRGEGIIGDDDRADVFIDVPTLRLDIEIVVDLDLYPVMGTARQDARLNYAFRNRELVKLDEHKIGHDQDAIVWDDGRFPPDSTKRSTYDELHTVILGSAQRLFNRLRYLTSEGRILAADDKPIVETSEGRNYLSSLKMPERYLFGRLKWERPYQNLVASVTWNKP